MDFQKELTCRVWTAFRRQYGGMDSPMARRIEEELEPFAHPARAAGFLALQLLAAKCRAAGKRYETSLDGLLAAYILRMTILEPPERKTEGEDSLSFRIRVGESMWEPLERSLEKFSAGDLLKSKALPGAYVLCPTQNGGVRFFIDVDALYTAMDEVIETVGPPEDCRSFSLWEGGFYHGYIPGFFDELEEYELRHSAAADLEALAALLEVMRQLPAARALRLAADYMEASSLLRRAPEVWFAAYLNQEPARSLFLRQSMGRGEAVCRRAMERNRDRMLFTEPDSAYRRKHQVFIACLAAYKLGLQFLPSDKRQTGSRRFLPAEGGIVCLPKHRSDSKYKAKERIDL